MRRPFFPAGLVGLLVVAMLAILIVVFPSNAPRLAEGYVTPIVAFELAESPADIHMMFGEADSPIRQQMIAAMNLGNELDYAYMVIYGTFLALFSVLCAKESGRPGFRLGAALAVLAVVADALENVQLLRITAKLGGDFTNELRWLAVFTWIKWESIAAIFVVLAPWFLSGGRGAKAIGIAGLATAVLGMAAFVLRRGALSEVFVLAVGLVFLAIIVYALGYRASGARVGAL